MPTIRVGGPPEHFNYPWRMAISSGEFAVRGLDVVWHDFPAGTGAMVEALDTGTLDVALLLTEGIVAAIDRGVPLRVAGTWVDSSLVWGVHVSTEAGFRSFDDLRGARFAISRPGSGSHLMALVEARRRGWTTQDLEFVVVGGIDNARTVLASGGADVFLWEKYTSRPWVRSGLWRCIDEVVAPWPAFVVGVRASDAITPVAELLDVVAPRCASLKCAPDEAAAAISNFYGLTEDDVSSWLNEVRWAATTQIDDAAISRARNALRG